MIFQMILYKMPGIVNSLKILGIILEIHVVVAVDNVNVVVVALLEDR